MRTPGFGTPGKARPRRTAAKINSVPFYPPFLSPMLHKRGLKPGQDIEVVSCNNEWPLLMGLFPRPAVVDIQGAKVGRRAVEQLFWRIADRQESRVVTQMTPTLATYP